MGRKNIENKEKRSGFDLETINPTALAYMGDAVYEVEIRKFLLGKGLTNVNTLHKRAIKYVNAGTQAAVIKNVFNALTEEEQALVKRARNRKTATKAKNVDPVTYKWATAFECLTGYLYLKGIDDRFSWLMDEAISIVEEDN